MGVLGFVLLAFTPGIFWLWFFAKRHVYRPAPRRLIALTFFLGMVSTIPAGIINTLFLDDSLLDGRSASLETVAAGMLFVVGPAEETCKFLAVRLFAFRSLYFDEPFDGFVYAAAASLGFASLENLIYIMQFGPEVMIGRAPLSTLAHVIFGSFWGYALGRQAQDGPRRFIVVTGVAVAAVVHGLFNVAVFTFPLAAVATVAIGLWWVLSRFRWARRVSPFRYKRNYPRVACLACRQTISILSRYCSYCGSLAGPPSGSLYCSHCGNANRNDAGFCTSCGDRLERRRR